MGCSLGSCFVGDTLGGLLGSTVGSTLGGTPGSTLVGTLGSTLSLAEYVSESVGGDGSAGHVGDG